MKKTEITQERKILLSKIHIAKKALGLDEETYRSVIFAAVGKTSGKACTDRQLLKVVKAFEEKGWKHRKNPNQYRKVPTGRADLEKIYALWGHLQDLGAVRSTNLVDLDKWVFRMTKGKRSSAQFLEESWAQRIIECLKKWIEREECKGGCRE